MSKPIVELRVAYDINGEEIYTSVTIYRRVFLWFYTVERYNTGRADNGSVHSFKVEIMEK